MYYLVSKTVKNKIEKMQDVKVTKNHHSQKLFQNCQILLKTNWWKTQNNEFLNIFLKVERLWPKKVPESLGFSMVNTWSWLDFPSKFCLNFSLYNKGIKAALQHFNIFFSRVSERQVMVYKIHASSLSLEHTQILDVSPAILIPHYDQDSSTLFLTSRVSKWIIDSFLVKINRKMTKN